MSRKVTAYECLGITEHATVTMIQRAWRALAFTHHPDRRGNVQTMQNINRAHDLLMKHRALYDAQLAQYRQPRIVITGWTSSWYETSTTTATSNA